MLLAWCSGCRPAQTLNSVQLEGSGLYYEVEFNFFPNHDTLHQKSTLPIIPRSFCRSLFNRVVQNSTDLLLRPGEWCLGKLVCTLNGSLVLGMKNICYPFGCTAPMKCEDGLGKVWWHLGCILCLCVWLYQRFFLAALTKLGSTQPLSPCLPCHSSISHHAPAAMPQHITACCPQNDLIQALYHKNKYFLGRRYFPANN